MLGPKTQAPMLSHREGLAPVAHQGAPDPEDDGDTSAGQEPLVTMSGPMEMVSPQTNIRCGRQGCKSVPAKAATLQLHGIPHTAASDARLNLGAMAKGAT